MDVGRAALICFLPIAKFRILAERCHCFAKFGYCYNMLSLCLTYVVRRL